MIQRVLALGAVVVAAVATAPVTSAAASGGSDQPLPPHSQRAVCGSPAPKAARCFAHVVTHKDSATPLATVKYASGYTPADLASAYQLPTVSGTPGSGPTVAIVDAYDNPNAENDMNAYRSEFGLGACYSGCFTKVNQDGQASPMPAGDTGWGAEIDLDLDMVSAACPTCQILLVEANSANFSDLITAVGYAVSNAKFVSNSYGGNEFSGETSYDSAFDKTGVAVTVSSGDNGYGVQYPAASQYVTAVGGTSLSRTSTGWSETAWSGAGSGCSALEPKPSWQHDTLCTRRTVADVSAVANPNTGVAVYDSYGSSGGANWFVYGGTSVASPFVAAVWALGPALGTLNTSPAPGNIPYLHTAGWNDVLSGSNTNHCRSGYLCQAGSGYDGPTGLGTPIGASGFGGAVGSGGSGTNTAPLAGFSASCSGMTCNFTDTSTDAENNITTRNWDFGDGTSSTATDPSHTYGVANTYNVTLTVTDAGGLSSSVTRPVTATATAGITLSASTSKPHRIDTVTLSWTGASGAVDIYRNGAFLTTDSTSPYTDSTGVKGSASFSYQVCPSGSTSGCSNTVTVNF